MSSLIWCSTLMCRFKVCKLLVDFLTSVRSKLYLKTCTDLCPLRFFCNYCIDTLCTSNVQHLCVRSECGKCVRAIPQGSHSVLTQALGDFCWSSLWMKKLATLEHKTCISAVSCNRTSHKDSNAITENNYTSYSMWCIIVNIRPWLFIENAGIECFQ